MPKHKHHCKVQSQGISLSCHRSKTPDPSLHRAFVVLLLPFSDGCGADAVDAVVCCRCGGAVNAVVMMLLLLLLLLMVQMLL